MNEIKIGSMVVRKSHNRDIIFKVIKLEKDFVLLSGVFERIIADSPYNDLEKIDLSAYNKAEKQYESYINETDMRSNKSIISGKILHIDGDKKYTQRSFKLYKKLGLNAIVRNVSEAKQPYVIEELLNVYDIDVLIITGHDGLIKKNNNYNDLNNYRNSKFFMDTVKKARQYEKINNKDIAIFAGACQSFYEGLIMSGANFASSPSRILINFTDPIIVAKKIALTDREKFLTIEDIEKELKDGRKGINGIGCNGKGKRIKNYAL